MPELPRQHEPGGLGQPCGWFMEPNCQACHSGTATTNRGQIRYTSAFTDANGTVRTPADATFATQTNTPAPGLSLYRFSPDTAVSNAPLATARPMRSFPARIVTTTCKTSRCKGMWA